MEEQVTITRARHAWPEPKGFVINRPRGLREYTFLRFHGSVSVLVGGKTVVTSPGACLFYDMDTPQWFQSSLPLVHDWMHMTGPVLQTLAQVGLMPDTLYQPADSEFVPAILREIEYELLSNPGQNSPLSQLKYQELLLKLSRAVNSQPQEPVLNSSVKARLRQARSSIFAALNHNWTVKEMAELAYLSPSRFHILYRKAFGISPVEDLIHARIDTAKNRLCDGDETVSQLAASLGYRNVTHFCRQFKQFTGMTPMQLRNARETK